jgi:N-acetylmuramoyl-L-alanine amidase
VRVLASIGKGEGLRALLAFSDLHENVVSRRPAGGTGSNQDLLQTERFVLYEVLQLICARAQALTRADTILVALAEGGDFVCRATAGPRPVPQGIRLNRESEFLRECLESGEILRCDDSGTDARVQLDFARQVDARSTVIVPLRGRSERLGVLQAFSAAPWSFADQDIRCLDLFAELVLAAVKPADQDRRFNWLTGVAGDVLQTRPAASEAAVPVVAEPPAATAAEPAMAAVSVDQVPPPPIAPAPAAPAQIEPSPVDLRKAEPEIEPTKTAAAKTEPTGPAPIAAPPAAPDVSAAKPAGASPALPDLGELTEPLVIPVESFESTDLETEQVELPTYLTFAEHQQDGELPLPGPEEQAPKRPFLRGLLFPLTASPGLSVVLALVLVAALFSAGVWWGMQAHANATPTRMAAAPRNVTTPGAQDLLATSAAPIPPVSAPVTEDILLTPVPDDKLAALPKITGVRHWSSSMGSTVVIDMEDQVNYEVHRLMSPERIYFDLHDTSLPRELDGKTMDVGDTSLTRVRVAQPVAGVTRIVLDTRDGSNFSVSMETNPYRLVVELRDSPKPLLAGRLAPSAATVAKPATTAPLTAMATKPGQPLPARTGKFRIVLDAGHGGWDLGTVGRQGLVEKDLVLDVTKRLGKLLQSRNGAEVVFTRSADDYVALDQRADIANQAQADLFVSVHANYCNSATARGVETYYTNLFSAPGLKEIEKHSDGTFAQPAPVTLSADGLHDKIEESRRLAASVQRALYAALATKSPDIRDRGIKDASFVVLTGTTMPAILTEISFVSSPADEHNLQSEAYRQQIAEALYKGIARYEESSPKTKVAQLRPTATGR